jgi:hypothetical protein
MTQAQQTVVSQVVFGRHWVGQADPREGQALLIFQIRNLLDRADGCSMRATRLEAGIEKAGDLFDFHVAVADSPGGRFYLDQGFQPE